MLPADGGGGYSGTPWYAYKVPDMWDMLKDQKTDNHWKQVTGWQKTYELTSEHLFRLQTYRDNLVAAWSPEKSEAAKKYVERLDYLIDNVQKTYDAAVSNHTTSSGAIGAISTARYELQQVYNEYAAKQKAANSKSSASSMPSVPSSEMPGGQNPTPTPSPGPSPTDQAELDRLDNKARGIMSKLAGELSQAQTQIKPPPDYKQTIKYGEHNNPDVYGGGGGGSSPPPIPPIVTVSGGSYSPPSHGAPPNIQPVPVPTAPGNGPILGGVGTLPPPPPPPPPTVTPLPPGINPAPPLPPGPLPPIPPGLPPTFGGGPFVPSTTTITNTSPLMRPSTPRAMPPGGMIGGSPGGAFGQPAAGTAARRINPVGGVIGGDRAGMTSTGTGTGTGRSPMAPGGRASGRRRGDEHGQHWDPDNPWETDEGVAPVVLPAREIGRIDPGPAIGFNR